VKPAIVEHLPELTSLRRDLHAHPELGFEEHRTADLVAEKLAAWGIEVHRGLGRTGVVGTVRAGSGDRVIALRADMDALAMPELADRPHRSTHPGRMHACGHDGHTTMLLGAAHYLSKNRQFDGTVHLIFQPAEEGRGGARAMVEDGFFDRFPVDAVYGMHNMPGLAPDQIAVVPGPQLASSDSWEVIFDGIGTHGAKPHLGRDAIAATGQFLTALNTIVSRQVDPLHAAVVSTCSIQAGDPAAWNVIPDQVTIRGTARAYTAENRDLLDREIGILAEGAAKMLGIRADYRFIRRIAPVVNDTAATAGARRAAEATVGADKIIDDFPPSTAGDDFSVFSAVVPGAYVWVGNGPAEDGALHHNSRYDFNDDAILTGASYWANLVELELALNE